MKTIFNKIFILLLLGFLSLYYVQYVNAAGVINLPQTGQTKCYDMDGDEISCKGTGQDGDIRAGQAWPNPRFSAYANDTIKDNLTALVWAKNAGMPSHKKCKGSSSEEGFDFSWEEGLEYVQCLNEEHFQGFNDWRLPNVNEMGSLLNFGTNNSPGWLQSYGFTNVKLSYWTSTSGTEFGGEISDKTAYIVSPYGNGIDLSNKSEKWSVWPVRGITDGPSRVWRTGQTKSLHEGDDGNTEAGAKWPDDRFDDKGDGTIVDKLTGLMWVKDAGCFWKKNWKNALESIKTFNKDADSFNCQDYDASYKDWRFPNYKELLSLYNYSESGIEYLRDNGFILGSNWYYWSSTSSTGDKPGLRSKTINFEYGTMVSGAKEWDDMFGFWPVRGGILGSETPPSEDKFSNIAFFPGLMGSRLYKWRTLDEDQLWEPNTNGDIEDLYLDADGKTSKHNIYTRDIIGSGQGVKKVYKEFEEFLKNDLQGKVIAGYKIFPYDWRLDLEPTVKEGIKVDSYYRREYIIDELKKLSVDSKSGKVTIIAHSNGGLLVKKVIDEMGNDAAKYIDRIVLVASPQLGTPAAMEGLLHANAQQLGFWDLGIIMDEERARTLANNMPTAYNLLPSRKYFDIVDNTVIKFDSNINRIDELHYRTQIWPIAEGVKATGMASSSLSK